MHYHTCSASHKKSPPEYYPVFWELPSSARGLNDSDQASLCGELLASQDHLTGDGLLWYRDKIFVPEGLQTSTLGLCNDHMLGGHFGISKTSELVQRTFWWPGVEKDCRRYV